MASTRALLFAVGLACCLATCYAQTLANCTDQGIVVTKTPLDSQAFAQLFWSNDSTVVFALTAQGSVYRSTDSGKTWNIQQPYMNESLILPVTETGRTEHGIRYIIPNSNSTVFYFQGYNGRLWITYDYGQSYSLTHPATDTGLVSDAFGLLKVYAHPTNPEFIMAITATECCYKVTTQCGGDICRLDIIASMNIGRTWILVHSDTGLVPSNDDPSFQPWGLGFHEDNYTTDYSMAFVSFPTGESGVVDVRYRSDAERSVIVTSDFRAPLNNIISTTSYITDFWHAAGPVMIMVNNVGLLYTTDGARTLQAGQFPPAPDAPAVLQGDDTGLPFPLVTFVADDGALWAVTTTDDGRIDLYADLDPAATSQFTHILIAPVFRTTTFDVDLEDVSVLSDGDVLIANQYVARGDSRIVTKMSWNRGADWAYLNPPTGMCTQDALNSAYGCHLHLQGAATNGYILTNYLAPGVILANGNVGSFLDLNNNTMSFITLDGGITWSVVNGTADTDDLSANFYALADNGGVLGFVDGLYSTNRLMWTLNFGDAWNNCLFDTQNINIGMFDSDPDSYFPALLMVGSANTTTTNGAITHIDFSSLVTRSCIFPDDYQTFQLKSGTALNSSCIMGQQITFIRRHPDSVCRIDENIQTATNITPCACARDDFVCDICFNNVLPSNECDFDLSCSYLAYTTAAPPANCTISYVAPITGYEKMAGTHCVGGAALDVGTRVLPCPPPTAPTTPVEPVSSGIDFNAGRSGLIAGAVVGSILGAGVLALAIFGIYKLVQSRRNSLYERQDLAGDEELK